jgi:ribA/ribD-fused uncharacterized protein
MTVSYATDGAPLTVAALLEKMRTGWEPAFFCFWGHKAPERQGVGKHVFSQWWPAAFAVDGVRYPTAEHWMMAEKARLFGDGEREAEILAAPTPGDAKALGRKVRGFDQHAWDAAAFGIVTRGNHAKFAAHPVLGRFLVATGERVLVEASPLDRVWGIGMVESDTRVADPARWEGQNLLGFALMAVRARLSDGGR